MVLIRNINYLIRNCYQLVRNSRTRGETAITCPDSQLALLKATTSKEPSLIHEPDNETERALLKRPLSLDIFKVSGSVFSIALHKKYNTNPLYLQVGASFLSEYRYHYNRTK